MGNRVPELTAYEHQGLTGTTGAKRSVLMGKDEGGNYVEFLIDSEGGIYTSSTPLTQAFAYSSGLLVYQGWAAPGSSKGATVWRICKLIYTGTDVTDIQWADGNGDFDNEWDERTSYSYL